MKKIASRKLPKKELSLHSHPLLNRIYLARGVLSPSEVEYELKQLLPYHSLKGIDQAVECLTCALQKQQHILVVGDFDVDGATGTALAVSALGALGFENVSYLLPSRFGSGYGLTPELVAIAAQKKPQLILTVDNGITSVDGISAANKLGIKVLVTDHHLPGDKLPDACAIVDPYQPGDEFPSKNLAGVGVVFYLMLALRAHLKKIGWFDMPDAVAQPNMAQFLDLVALGTVADVVGLDHNNRILVEQGLKRIRAGQCGLGIKAILAASGRSYEKILASDLGFVVAPRLNAVGRLDDMTLGVECLLTQDVKRAQILAKKLDALNNERRAIEEDMRRQADKLLDDLQLTKKLPQGICVFKETWHQGVLGILASRLKDKFSRPVAVFTAVDETEAKGSVRSTANVHMRNVLSNISIKNPGLLNRFGGHAMAAGLSINKKNYKEFEKVFAAEVDECLKLTGLDEVIYTDGQLPDEYFNMATAKVLRTAGPWGQDFLEPTFHGEFTLVNQRLVGQKHLKLTLRSLESDQDIEAICFNIDPNVWPNFRCSKATLVYRLDINEYNGRRTLQLMVEEIMNHE